MAETAAGDSAAKKKPSKGKGFLYVGIVAALVVAAAGIYFWSQPSASSGAAPAEPAVEATLPLETFVVNLDAGEDRAYLRVGVTLGMSRALPHKKEDIPVAALRDAILSVLSSAHPGELVSAEGKQKLKADLLKAVQERSPELGIDSVYFTEFLVQM